MASIKLITKIVFMSEVQFDLLILGLIILINFFITSLYRKYNRLKLAENKVIDLANHSSSLSVTPGSFMPRIPFLILGKSKTKSLKNVIILHNVLCIVVYGLFALAIMYHF